MQTLSNHHPCLINIVLEPIARMSQNKLSYLKLDGNELVIYSTCEVIKLVWVEQMRENRNPCVNLELGWKAIKMEMNIKK